MKELYDEILKLVEKSKDNLVYDFSEMKTKAKIHLFGIELKEKYGLDIDPKNMRSLDYNSFGDHLCISRYGEGRKRTISWPDQDRQPENELLLQIGFPTGAYIFGKDYPKELFQKFFNELKTYKPKYTDSHNDCLYFSMDNASGVFNNFKAILQKYYKLNETDYNARKIKKMEEDLKKLKMNN